MNENYNPKVAGILALFFGYTGAHKFYTGDFKNGFFRAIAFYLAYVFGWKLVIFILFIMGVTEGIKLLKSTKQPKSYSSNDSYLGKKRILESKQNSEQGNLYLGEGIAAYKQYDYQQAKEYFEKAYALIPFDNRVNFNLACTYSMLEEIEKSIFHLDQAVSLGYADHSNITKHDGLAFIRTTPEYTEWRNATIVEDRITEMDDDKADLLEQLRILREAKENGIIDSEDYEKKRIDLLGRN